MTKDPTNQAMTERIIGKVAEATVWIGFMAIVYGVVLTLGAISSYFYNACYSLPSL